MVIKSLKAYNPADWTRCAFVHWVRCASVRQYPIFLSGLTKTREPAVHWHRPIACNFVFKADPIIFYSPNPSPLPPIPVWCLLQAVTDVIVVFLLPLPHLSSPFKLGSNYHFVFISYYRSCDQEIYFWEFFVLYIVCSLFLWR